MIVREIEKSLINELENPEIVILFGARQVGKTTLIKMLKGKTENTLLLNCELPSVSSVLSSKNIAAIKMLFSSYKIIALDEAQSIPEIGQILKIIYDEMPEYKILATGSSSFNLAQQTGEPLTGRNIKYKLFPFSLTELQQQNDYLWIINNLEHLLIFGFYPGIVSRPAEEREKLLRSLSSDYLFKDILALHSIKNSLLLRKLLKALALQIGSQVSNNELSNMLGINRYTLEQYLDILEQSFIIFHLDAYSSNMRNEIKKSKKYYFYDNGILNAIIEDFRFPENRKDSGAIWENFCVSERLKQSHNKGLNSKLFFWRTYDGAEIDLLEQNGTELKAFEFKWSKKINKKLPPSFVKKYKIEECTVITRDNLHVLL